MASATTARRHFAVVLSALQRVHTMARRVCAIASRHDTLCRIHVPLKNCAVDAVGVRCIHCFCICTAFSHKVNAHGHTSSSDQPNAGGMSTHAHTSHTNTHTDAPTPTIIVWLSTNELHSRPVRRRVGSFVEQLCARKLQLNTKPTGVPASAPTIQIPASAPARCDCQRLHGIRHHPPKTHPEPFTQTPSAHIVPKMVQVWLQQNVNKPVLRAQPADSASFFRRVFDHRRNSELFISMRALAGMVHAIWSNFRGDYHCFRCARAREISLGFMCATRVCVSV